MQLANVSKTAALPANSSSGWLASRLSNTSWCAALPHKPRYVSRWCRIFSGDLSKCAEQARIAERGQRIGGNDGVIALSNNDECGHA
jgi:hypothetical protein